MVFSLKNVDDAGFGFRDSSKLGSLLNQKRRANQEEARLVNVWGSFGHVFVTTNKGCNLHAFEAVPRSKWSPESEGLLLQDHESPIVSVLSSATSPSVIFIVHQNSMTQCWDFTQSNFKWVKRNDFQLSNTKRVEVLQVVLHPLVNAVLWCERRSVSPSCSVSCCVCLRELTISDRLGSNAGVSMGPLVVILHGCPSMLLHVIGRGVCMVPEFLEELKDIMLFWTFLQRTLKVYMWSYGYIGGVDKVDFKAIIADLLCPWVSNTKESSSHITAVLSHPKTYELLVLDNALELSYFRLQDCDPILNSLVKLGHDLSPCSDKVSRLFAFGLFAGVIWDSGMISIYDIGSGAHLCKLEDLQGQNVQVWGCQHLVNSVGFWSISGIWKLQSGTVVEVSECIRSSLSCKKLGSKKADLLKVGELSNNLQMKTQLLEERGALNGIALQDFKRISEESVIPEFVSDAKTNEKSLQESEQNIFAGPLFAANHLIKWNMKHRAAKIALDSIVSSQIVSDGHKIDEEVPELFLDLLMDECTQSPAMALALLWEHPIYRELISSKLEQHTEESCERPQRRKTCLTALLHPYISEFLFLSKQIKLPVDCNSDERNLPHSLPTNSVHEEVTALLEEFDVGSLDVTSLERLSTLTYQQPQKVLDLVTEYLKMDSESKDFKDSQWEQRWKKIYRLEWRKQRWQKKRVALKEPINSILSILLHLFHKSKSEFLTRSVEKGMSAIRLGKSDVKPQEYILQSVLECLPVLHTSNTNAESVKIHAQLYYSIGQETQALDLLLTNQMWEEAIDFVSCCGKDSETQTLLFVMLFKALQYGKAPSGNLVKALSLKPADFNTHELLAMIMNQAPVSKDPFDKGPGHTSLGDLRPFLDVLFTSPNVT